MYYLYQRNLLHAAVLCDARQQITYDLNVKCLKTGVLFSNLCDAVDECCGFQGKSWVHHTASLGKAHPGICEPGSYRCRWKRAALSVRLLLNQ